MKTIVLLLIGVTVVAGAMFAPSFGKEAKGADRFSTAVFEVKRGDLDISVTENGYLKAENSEQLKPLYDGQSTITWLAEEGASVKEGDLLVEFDATDIENEINEQKTRLIQYEAELEAAEANLAIQERDNEAAIEKAELALEVANLSLEKYEGEYKNQVRTKQLSIEKAETELRRAQEAYSQVPALIEEGFLTPLQGEAEELRKREAEINLENAQFDLELFETLTRPMEFKQKQSDIRDAERNAATAHERAAINLNERKARVSQNQRLVQSTKDHLADLEKDLGHMKIHAPRPGIVIYGDPANRWMQDQVQVGNSIWQGLTVITLPDLSSMQVLINIHEADIDLIEEGQECTITIDTYKGKIFRGIVTDVATVASSGNWGDSSNKQFRVEVSMQDLDIELRAGITAKVEIKIEKLEDVLYTPIHAVFKDGEEFVCFTPSPGGFARKVVEIGKSNEHYVVIESGLAAGEKVLLFDPREDEIAEQDADGGEAASFGPGTDGSGDDESGE